MEKRTPINSSLGVTQEELSMLLGITRSKWSMYELGIGRLPIAASKLLSELFTHVAAAQKISKPRPQIIQQKVIEERLTRLLQENHYQSLLTAKKIGIAEKKLADQMRLAALVQVLEKNTGNQSPAAFGLLDIVRNKTSEKMEAEAEMALFKLQVKKQLLELEKTLFEAKFP